MNKSDANDFLDKSLDSLEHYGIKGMAWGVKNGPPYPLADQVNKAIRKYNHDEARSMSTKQLQEKISRYNLENQYKRLAKERSNPKLAAIEKFVKNNSDKILAALVTTTAIAVGKYFLTKRFPKIMDPEAIKKLAKAAEKIID